MAPLDCSGVFSPSSVSWKYTLRTSRKGTLKKELKEQQERKEILKSFRQRKELMICSGVNYILDVCSQWTDGAVPPVTMRGSVDTECSWLAMGSTNKLSQTTVCDTQQQLLNPSWRFMVYRMTMTWGNSGTMRRLASKDRWRQTPMLDVLLHLVEKIRNWHPEIWKIPSVTDFCLWCFK